MSCPDGSVAAAAGPYWGNKWNQDKYATDSMTCKKYLEKCKEAKERKDQILTQVKQINKPESGKKEIDEETEEEKEETQEDEETEDETETDEETEEEEQTKNDQDSDSMISDVGSIISNHDSSASSTDLVIDKNEKPFSHYIGK